MSAEGGVVGGGVAAAEVGLRMDVRPNRVGLFSAPKSLIGPGKFPPETPATMFSPASRIDVVSSLTRRPSLAADSSFGMDGFERLAQETSELVARAARGILAIHDVGIIFESSKPRVLAGMGGEQSRIWLTPEMVADVLTFDPKIERAFAHYVRAAGYPVKVDSVLGISADSVMEIRDASYDNGKKNLRKMNPISQQRLVVGEKELFDKELSQNDVDLWRSQIAGEYGVDEEAIAFTLATALGIIGLGPRALQNMHPDLGKDEILNPLAVGQLRTLATSPYMGPEVGSFFDEPTVSKGLKGGVGSVATVLRDSTGTMVDTLRSLQPTAIKMYWGRMARLKKEHDRFKLWQTDTNNLGLDGRVINTATTSPVAPKSVSVYVWGLVDSLMISRDHGEWLVSRFSGDVGFFKKLP